PVRLREHAIVPGDDENVRIRREENLVRRKILIERREHRDRERIIELVEMEPLAEHPVWREAVPHSEVELGREESRDRAHPRVRRLGNDEIKLATARPEVRLGVVEHERRARVIEDAVTDWDKRTRGRDHLRLDLDGGEPPYVRTAE